MNALFGVIKMLNNWYAVESTVSVSMKRSRDLAGKERSYFK